MKHFLSFLLGCTISLTPTISEFMGQESWAQAQDIATQIQQLKQKAFQYSQQGKPLQAIETWQQILNLAQESKDNENESFALIGIGFNYKNIGKYQKALDYFNEAFTIFQKTGNNFGKITILNNIGAVYDDIGQPRQALYYYQQSLSIVREEKAYQMEVRILNNIGTVHDDIGQPQQALDYYNQALSIIEKSGSEEMKATILNNIGAVHDDIGQPQKALDYYNQALSLFRKAENHFEEAAILNNIGALYYDIRQFQKALDYYNQALPIRREVRDSVGEAVTLDNIGKVYYRIGKFQQALTYYQQALPIRREVRDRSGEATTLNNIGKVYHRIGKFQQALNYYQQALPIVQEIEYRSGEATTLSNIASVYKMTNLPNDALGYYNQALSIYIEVRDRSGEAITLNNIGSVYDNIEQPQQALTYYQQALPIRREVRDRSGEATTLSNIALAYRKINQLTEAIANLEQSVKISLEIRLGLLRENRKSFLQAERGSVIALTNLLIEQNKAERAYEWINRFTTFELADYTRLIKAKVAHPQAQLAVDEWKQKTQQLTELYEQLNQQLDDFSESSPEISLQIRSLEAEVNQLAENTIEQFPEIAELFETTPEDIDKLRANLPSDTLVIQPVLLTNVSNVPNNIAIFILSKDQPLSVIKVSINPREFDDLISQYRNKLQNRSARGFKGIGGELYDLLIRPVEEQIETLSPNRIAIIPTGKLRYIPFETLYDQQTKQYLIEKYPVHYFTRLSVNSLQSEQSISNRQGVLALGNPVPIEPYDLPATEAEVDSISQIIPRSEKYARNNATLDTFKFQGLQFPFLHLATHGCFQPEGCCLKSEGCSPNQMDMEANTILFANQNSFHIRDAALLGMKNVELITLSACQTALKADSDGQEIAGLAYLFERAGAKSVMASLWNVDDNATKEIMVQFYQNLHQGMSKVDALRQAKRKHTHRHPFFWSSFILVGNGN